MNYENIAFEVQDNVGILTVNRPKVMNALNSETLKELKYIAQKIKEDEDVRVLVVTGAGDKAFVAGADISEFPKMTPLQAREFSALGHSVCSALEKLPIPVIACVNGFALGGGCELALSCDFIYASEKAKFGQPEINLGLMPGFGGSQRLTRLVGRAKSKELCMTGEQIKAEEAKELGIVAKIFGAEEIKEKTMEVAKSLAKKGRISLKAVKEAINDGAEVDLETGCSLEEKSFGLCFTSVDAKEGTSAFLEKRDPDFKGTFSS